MDQLFQNAMKFAKQYMKTHPTKGMSNVYVIRKTNAAGESTGEYYGMNQITEYGFTQFIENEQTFPTNVYFGKASLNMDDSTAVKAIVEPISSYPATVRDATIDYVYPLIYDSSSWNDMYYLTCKYVTVYIPANSQNFPSEPTSITEYGIGESVDALWTYSRIYDENGNKIIVDRLPDEELEITVYFVMGVAAYYMSYRSNTPIITTMHRFFERFRANIKTVKNDVVVPRSVTYDTGVYSGSGRFITGTMTDLLIPDAVGDANGYIDGMFDCSTGFLCADPSNQNQTIDKTVMPDIAHLFDSDYLENMAASVPWSDVGHLSVGTGTAYFVPRARSIVDGTLKSLVPDLFRENWDIFASDKDPGGIQPVLFKKEYAMPLYVTNGDTIETYYVYRNTGTVNYVAKGLTVYVTDKFYKRSSWVTLSGYNSGNRFKLNVSSQKTKKFFITTTNSVDLLPSDYAFPYGEFTTTPDGYDPSLVPNGIVCQCDSLIGDHDFVGNYTIPNLSTSPNDTLVYNAKADGSYADQNIRSAWLLIEKNASYARVYGYHNGGIFNSQLCMGEGTTALTWVSQLFDSYISHATFIDNTHGYSSNITDRRFAVCMVDSLGMMDCIIRYGTNPYNCTNVYDDSGTVVSACVIDGNINLTHGPDTRWTSSDIPVASEYITSYETPTSSTGDYWHTTTTDEGAYHFYGIRLAVITSDAPKTLKIYKFSNRSGEAGSTEVDDRPTALSNYTPYVTVSIGDSSTPNPVMVYAYNEIIAVSDGATYTWIAKITDASTITSVMVNTAIPFTTSDTSIRYADFVTLGDAYVTNMFLIYKNNGTASTREAYLVTASNVYNIGSRINAQSSGPLCSFTIAQTARDQFNLVASYQYPDNNGTGVTNVVYDLSKYVYDSSTLPVSTVETSTPGKMYIVRRTVFRYPSASYSPTSTSVGILTRGKKYQIERFTPLNLHIVTNAITAIDGNKLVSNRWVAQSDLIGYYPSGTPM